MRDDARGLAALALAVMARDCRRARLVVGRLLFFCGLTEAALLVAFLATPLPWPVPVAGMTHAAVPHDFHVASETR